MCSSQTSRVSVATQFQPNTSAYSLGINHFKNVYYTVPKVAMDEYNQCVDFTLRELQAGEQCKWEVPGVAIGIVKLVQIDATGCHYMSCNTMMYRNKQRTGKKLHVTVPLNNGDSTNTYIHPKNPVNTILCF